MTTNTPIAAVVLPLKSEAIECANQLFLRVDISEVEAQLIKQQIGYHCPHCKSSGFLQEDDGRCSFCSGRENGECIHCGEICTGDTCTVCGHTQARGAK